ncbi:MAG TPA: hypothetical protein VIS76_14360 [Pseudomonadales bacterium]
MNRMYRMAAMAVIALGVVLSAPSQAASGSYRSAESGPRWEDQTMDALVARPIGIVGTGLGAIVWTVSLPFSLLGGNAGEAADSLVGGPARETFLRCLGCRSGRRQADVPAQ